MTDKNGSIPSRNKKTRWAWQSQTWSRPSPQVWVESQFRHSKFLSQQSPLANDSENYILEPRGVWSLQLTVYELYPDYHHCLAARRLEKFREDTPTSPEVIWTHTLNFRPNFNFRHYFFSGGPHPGGGAIGSLDQSLKRVKIWRDSTP